MLKVAISVIIFVVLIFGDDDYTHYDDLKSYRRLYGEYEKHGSIAAYNDMMIPLQNFLPGFTLAVNSSFYDVFLTFADKRNFTFSDQQKSLWNNATKSFCPDEHTILNYKINLLRIFVECYVPRKEEGFKCLKPHVVYLHTATDLPNPSYEMLCYFTKGLRNCFFTIFEEFQDLQKMFLCMDLDNSKDMQRSVNTETLYDESTANSFNYISDSSIKEQSTTATYTQDSASLSSVSNSKVPAIVNNDFVDGGSVTSKDDQSIASNANKKLQSIAYLWICLAVTIQNLT